MAGCMADGWRTVAPKKASSVASSKVSRGTGRASLTILGSDVSTPAELPLSHKLGSSICIPLPAQLKASPTRCSAAGIYSHFMQMQCVTPPTLPS